MPGKFIDVRQRRCTECDQLFSLTAKEVGYRVWTCPPCRSGEKRVGTETVRFIGMTTGMNFDNAFKEIFVYAKKGAKS